LDALPWSVCLVSLLAIAVVSDVLVAIDLYMRSRPAGPGRRPLFKSLSKQQVLLPFACSLPCFRPSICCSLIFVSSVIVWHLRALLACGQMVTLATGSLCFTGFVILLAAEVCLCSAMPCVATCSLCRRSCFSLAVSCFYRPLPACLPFRLHHELNRSTDCPGCAMLFMRCS
jgi:hypothetical protein